MLYFLSQRVERLRHAVNPDAGVILAHHTRKLGKQFEDPFQALAGAGGLRGYYSTGMLLYRPDESPDDAPTHLRATERPRHPAQARGQDSRGMARSGVLWTVWSCRNTGNGWTPNVATKRDVILILFDEAGGALLHRQPVCRVLQGKAGLGGERAIRERLSALSLRRATSSISAIPLGLRPAASYKYSYMCVEGMVLRLPIGEPDPDTD